MSRIHEVTVGPVDPEAVLAGCIESGSHAVLLGAAAVDDRFVDLGTRIAGELLHRLSAYRIRLAGVVPDPAALPERFREFLRETNRGSQARFFVTRAEAVAWLEGARATGSPPAGDRLSTGTVPSPS